MRTSDEVLIIGAVVSGIEIRARGTSTDPFKLNRLSKGYISSVRFGLAIAVINGA